MLRLGETATLGAFLAQDLLLFVLFFDLMLVPFYFLIGAVRRRERPRSRRRPKMIVYTLVGSLLMLVARDRHRDPRRRQAGELTFSIADLRATLLGERQPGLDLLLLRRRLPGQDAGLPRSTAGCPTPTGPRRCRSLALLSGVLSKVGAYGFLRVVLPLFPDATVALPGGDPGDRASPRSSTAR